MRGLYKHIPTGKFVFISNGQYEVNGRVSNHFSGNVVGEDGMLTDEILGDYNTRNIFEKVDKYIVKIEFNKDKFLTK